MKLKRIFLPILKFFRSKKFSSFELEKVESPGPVFTSNFPSASEPLNAIGEHIVESGFYQSLALIDEPPIVDRQSLFQNITIVRSKYYGKILALDGVIQLTEKDANSYNEMMAHPAMFAHHNPKRVLVIGGGDGYVLHEVLKHPSVEHVDHVDLDSEVIDVCRKHFSWGHAWEDPRVSLHITDGASFVAESEDNYYDVIVQDSSDPDTWDEYGQEIDLPSKVLYEMDHFENIYRILSDQGVFSFQAECFGIASDLVGIVEWRKQAIETGFRSARYGSLTISSYPTGQIGYILCEKDPQSSLSKSEIQTRFDNITNSGQGTTYYHPKLQSSSFDLPLWVEQRIYGSDSELVLN